MTTSWKLITGLLLLVLSFCTGWVVNVWRLSAYQEAEKVERIQSNADHFRDATKKINAEASQYSGNSGQLEKQITELKKELSNAQKNNRVPVDCSPDGNRLRVLKDAVRAANTAARQ